MHSGYVHNAQSVKRFEAEQSNGLDTAVYKNIPLPLQISLYVAISSIDMISYLYQYYHIRVLLFISAFCR